jgi:malate dehydrogenase (oxaloacetate-decarboxylating)
MVQDVTQHAVLGFDPNPVAQQRLLASGGDLAKDLAQLMDEADLVIAVSGQAGLIGPELIRRGQGILALTNPKPEILPEEALAAGAAFAADGRSVNNLLGFPGILRASIDCRATRITRSMYIAAARTIASHAEENELVPSPLRPEVHRGVARAVAQAAQEAGVARVRVPSDYQQDEVFHTLRSN